jgi:hypothetical protein
MTPLLLVLVVLALVLFMRLADVYLGGHYSCPSCGARSQEGHSSDCPWN